MSPRDMHDLVRSSNRTEKHQNCIWSPEMNSEGQGLLGEGSFGQVKGGLHLMTQTLVAIQILKRGTRIVISEIDIMTSLYHNHIIKLLQVIDTMNNTFLVMEYAAQGSLWKIISKRGHLDEEEAGSIFRESTSIVRILPPVMSRWRISF